MKKAIIFSVIFISSLILFKYSGVNIMNGFRKLRAIPSGNAEVLDQVYRNDKYGFEFHYPPRWKNEFYHHFSVKELRVKSEIVKTIQKTLPYKYRNLQPEKTTISGKEVLVFNYTTGTIHNKLISLPVNSKANLQITISDDLTYVYTNIDDILVTFKFTDAK